MMLTTDLALKVDPAYREIWPTEAEESGKAPTPVRFERGSAPGQRHAP